MVTPNNLEIDEETIKAASGAAMEAHRNPQPYSFNPISSSVEIIAFRGSWSENDWVVSEGKDSWGLFNGLSVEKTTVEPVKNSNNPLLQDLPSLRSIGNVEVAKVNEAFFNQFLLIKNDSDFNNKVNRSVEEKKKIIFTGHSGAGPIAILATIWLLEQLKKSNRTQSERPLCVTFGSPLTGNYILNHALRREKWADNFIHFVNRYDIVPRVFLAPPSITKPKLQQILAFFGTNISVNSEVARELFETVLRYASCVASEAACSIMGSTNNLQDTISSFIELSPYRPFGTYVFCSGNGKFVVVKNADAVLQLLVFSSQLSSEEADEVANASLKQHFTYQHELGRVSENDQYHFFPDFVPGQDREEDESDFIDNVLNEPALDNLGLSARARLGILAAREWEKQKKLNQKKHESKMKHMTDLMKELVDYRAKRDASKVGYYDGFKQQKEEYDFNANIKRLELAGIWDEILELLKKRPMQLPDEFEGDETWIKMGTEYRRLVEPLDIANYYRHSKGIDSKEYLRAGSRPKRYFFTQRWLEHYKQMEEVSGESTFWAVVEELKIKMSVKEKRFEDVKGEILKLDESLGKWYQRGDVHKDAFLDKSTLVEWWNTLPVRHTKGLHIQNIINTLNTKP